jgi:hypothetical protein
MAMGLETPIFDTGRNVLMKSIARLFDATPGGIQKGESIFLSCKSIGYGDVR